MVRDLGPLAFQTAITELLGAVDYDWIGERERPVGLFLGKSMAAGRGAEVQVDWMPWTSQREKLEVTGVFLREVGKRVKIFIFASAEDEDFYKRLCQYRLLRNGCTVLDHMARGTHARLYYTPGPD